MSLLISAMSSTPIDFTDEELAAVDAMSFSLSEGNWREHLCEVSLKMGGELTVDARDLDREERDYIDYYAGKVVDDHTRWHLGIAQKVRNLIAAGQTCGCDQVGEAG